MSNIEFESDNQFNYQQRRNINSAYENNKGPFFYMLSKTGIFKDDESIKKALIAISVIVFAISIIIFLINI